MRTAHMLASFVVFAGVPAAFAGQHLATGDFNGDGRADLAIGVPFEDVGTVTDAGAVHVLYGRVNGVSAVNDDYWHQNKPGIVDDPEFADRFGRAVASGDFNGDGFDDLAIAVDENGNEGAVHVLYGAANGLVVAGAQFFNQSTSSGGESVSTDGFGTTLAVGDFNSDGFDDLAVGEPFDQVYLQSFAGSVTILLGSAQRLGHDVQYWHQQLGFVGDVAEAGDRFGDALAAGDFNGDGRDDLAIGIPSENVGSVGDAGIVQILFGSPIGLTDVGSEIWRQNTPDIADAHESGDNFGASLAAGDFNADGRDDLAIGVPLEKLAGKLRTGAVHVLYGSESGLRAGGDDFWNQNRTGIDDECETDDEFGFALSAGDFNSDGRDDLAIGVRGEGLEAEELTFCGAITVLYGTPSGLKTNDSQFWHLDQPNMPGDPANARFGTSMAVGDFDGDGFPDLAASAPGEKVDAVEKAGAVHILYGSGARLIATHGAKWWHQSVTGIADECEASDGFGGTPP